MLYENQLLNTKEFKTGRYALFNDTRSTENFDKTYVSNYNESGSYVPRFYKVKLFQQLENKSIVDLTSNIWTKYLAAGKNGLNQIKHWAWDNTFKYYCPNQYKGILLSSVELEDIYKFEPYTQPTITPSSTSNEYQFSFKINTGLKTSALNYVLDTYSLIISKILVKYWVDGSYNSKEVSVSQSFLTGSNKGDNITEIIVTGIDATKSRLRYEIIPVLSTKGGSDLYYSLPEKYLLNYRIANDIEIKDYVENIKIVPVEGALECDLVNRRMDYTEFVLMKGDSYVDNALAVTSTPYVFLKNGSSSKLPSSTILYTYNIGADLLPSIVSTQNAVPDYVLNIFENTVVSEPSDECNDLVTVNLTFNLPVTAFTNITVTQEGVYQGAWFNIGETSGYIKVIRNVPAIIEIRRQGFIEIIYEDTFIDTETLNFAFIAEIFQYANSGDNYWEYLWNGAVEALPISTDLMFEITLQGKSPFTTSLVPYGSYAYKNNPWAEETVPIESYPVQSISIDGSPVADGTYLNMNPSVDYVSFQNILFKSTLS